MTTTQQSELLRHLGEHPDGVRLVNDLGPEETESLFSLTYRNADGAELRANLFQRYAREQLDQTSRTTFARLTGDPDVQKSWVRAAGASDVKYGNVEKTLKRVEDLESDGHGVLEFHRSNELNPDFDGRPPHADNEIVADFDINGEKTLYRVRDADFAVGGTWTVELNVLRNAETKSEIIDKLALLPDEWNREYTKVSKLETSQVEKDARLRVSTTGEMSVPERGVHRNGGIRQYKVHTGDEEYVESGWETHGDLSDFVNVEE